MQETVFFENQGKILILLDMNIVTTMKIYLFQTITFPMKRSRIGNQTMPKKYQVMVKIC